MSMRLTQSSSAAATLFAIAAAPFARKSLLRSGHGGETVPPNDFSNE